MALVKCKECGEQVSTKAKVCPSCGGKAPKKTSIVTWLVLIVIIIGGWGAVVNTDSSSSRSSIAQSSSSRSSPSSSDGSSSARRTASPDPAWTHFTSKDEMTGKLSAYASSPKVSPNSRMDFPYADTKAWIAVGCDNKSEWTYFGFTNAPNLNDTDIQDGRNIVRTRIRWDETVENTSLTQKWGAAFLHFRNGKSAIARIAGSKSVLLELDWHGQSSVYFKFTLNGSSKAIKDIRKLCSK